MQALSVARSMTSTSIIIKMAASVARGQWLVFRLPKAWLLDSVFSGFEKLLISAAS